MADVSAMYLSIDGEVTTTAASLSGDVTIPADVAYYSGDFEVEPSSEETVLQTEGKLMSRNITIKPVPSNYGLITWNGATLTVS